jgi:hypothetical protein
MSTLNNCVDQFNKCITDGGDFALCFRLYGRCLTNVIVRDFNPNESGGVLDLGGVGLRFISYIISQTITLQINYAPIFAELKKSDTEFSRNVRELITGIEETLNQNEKAKQFLSKM